MENGRGKERKMTGGLAAAVHVKDRWKRLKQKLFKTESAIKNILSKKLSAERPSSPLPPITVNLYPRIPNLILT
jgi:hypothetical protein